MNITREERRRLGIHLQMIAHGRADSALVDISARDAQTAGDILTTPAWFSATELRMAADAMDILDYSTADAWTLRQRLDDFWRSASPLKNSGVFAAYLKQLPNGGMQ